MIDLINRIQKQFLEEAISSPLLFRDLASMEKYISESYTGRSLIELLQNADDACADKFYIESLDDNTYIVANDGRYFTEEDLISLCRSGASTKTRKSNTIGFRGIGFKSVVNYADKVHLISGDIKCTFSREATSNLVNTSSLEVPLIRIPIEFTDSAYLQKIEDLEKQGYNTIFIFCVNSNMLFREVREFTNDSMIFLQSVNSITFNNDERISMSKETRAVDNIFVEVSLHSNSQDNKWLVTKKHDSSISSIAFRTENNQIIAANTSEAVIHSFLPTHSKLSIPIKINGDFSTDPSRTKVVIDENSYEAGLDCARILTNLIKNILTSGEDRYGVINIAKNAQIDPLSNSRGEDINDVIVSALKDEFLQFIYEHEKTEIHLQPIGMTDDDFESIVKYHRLRGISKKLENKIPGLFEFLKVMGLEYLPLNDTLMALRSIEGSEQTRISVLSDAVKTSRFGLPAKMLDNIRAAKLISFNSGVKSIDEICKDDSVDANFENSVMEHVSSSIEYTSFARKIGLNDSQIAMSRANGSSPDHIVDSSIATTTIRQYGKMKNMKKWRSAEKNVAAILELMENVESVIDVSTQNLGYDLEVSMSDGVQRYYEVKSVDSMGDLISVTTNEYSTGAQLRKHYYLAIASQADNKIEVCFVSDPINRLKFDKRVTRWEWTCDRYDGEVVTTEWE